MVDLNTNEYYENLAKLVGTTTSSLKSMIGKQEVMHGYFDMLKFVLLLIAFISLAILILYSKRSLIVLSLSVFSFIGIFVVRAIDIINNRLYFIAIDGSPSEHYEDVIKTATKSKLGMSVDQFLNHASMLKYFNNLTMIAVISAIFIIVLLLIVGLSEGYVMTFNIICIFNFFIILLVYLLIIFIAIYLIGSDVSSIENACKLGF